MASARLWRGFGVVLGWAFGCSFGPVSDWIWRGVGVVLVRRWRGLGLGFEVWARLGFWRGLGWRFGLWGLGAVLALLWCGFGAASVWFWVGFGVVWV